METTFIFPSDNTRFEENGSENTLSNDLELTLFKDFLLRKGASDKNVGGLKPGSLSAKARTSGIFI